MALPVLAIFPKRGLSGLAPVAAWSLVCSMAPTHAQQVVADGTTQTASGTLNTGTAGPPAGYALYALNNGIITSTGALTLITGGNSANGVNATSGGQITIASGSTLTATGAGAIAMSASGTGTGGVASAITATDTVISTAATNLYGAYATQGGVINLTGGSVAAGAGSIGLFAFLGNATIHASGVAVATVGTNGVGVEANLAGVVNLTGGSVTTTGASGYGLYTIGTGATLNATGTVVQTTGNSAIGAFVVQGQMTLQNVSLTTYGASANGADVDNASSLTLTGGSVTTHGASAYGLLGTAGSTLTATNVAVTTTNSSGGVTSQFGARVTLNGGSVSTTGDSAPGLFAVGLQGATGASLVANGVAVTTSGANSHGATVRGGSSLTIANASSITTTGPGSAALYASAYDANPGTATITGSTLKSVQDAGIRTSGTTLNASLTGSSLSGGSALLQAINGGTLNLTADSSTLTGAALTDMASGSISNVTLQNKSTWTVTGNSNLSSLANGGTVSIAGGAPGTTLTVAGPYVGRNGTLSLGTALGGSNSVSDRLILSGPTAVASGNTTVQITNLSGLGALTAGNGIELISGINGATTTAQTTRDAFALAGGHVDAGAYEYRLYAADVNGAGENWYLRSASAPVPPEPPVPPPPPGPTPEVLPPVEVPTYRAEVPMLAALPSQLRQADLAMLGNLHQRIGDEDVKGSADPDARERRAWGRVISTDLDIRQEGTVSPSSKGRLNGLQAGTDLWADPNWRAGVYVGQLEGGVDVDGFARGVAGLRVGRSDLRSQYLGGYATYASSSGFYADGVLQAARHSYTGAPLFDPQFTGKGHSWLASIELGQSFALAPNWQIEPQLQLAHQSLSLDDEALFGALVQQNLDSNWLVRAGVRVKGEVQTAAGLLQPYARLNVYHTSSGTDVARFIGPAALTDIVSRTGYTSTELAAGSTLRLSPATSVYGELGTLFASGGSQRVKGGLQGSAGVRVRW